MVDISQTMSALESQIMHGLPSTEARVAYITQLRAKLEDIGKALLEREAYAATKRQEEARELTASLESVGVKKGQERLFDADYATQQAYLQKYGNTKFAERIKRELEDDRRKGIVRR